MKQSNKKLCWVLYSPQAKKYYTRVLDRERATSRINKAVFFDEKSEAVEQASRTRLSFEVWPVLIEMNPFISDLERAQLLSPKEFERLKRYNVPQESEEDKSNKEILQKEAESILECVDLIDNTRLLIKSISSNLEIADLDKIKDLYDILLELEKDIEQTKNPTYYFIISMENMGGEEIGTMIRYNSDKDAMTDVWKILKSKGVDAILNLRFLKTNNKPILDDFMSHSLSPKHTKQLLENSKEVLFW